jgi:hypothetical protein
MNDEQAIGTGRSIIDLDELIALIDPLLAAHPNEYLITISRDDDSGIRDGSHGRDSLRESSEGRVMNTAYSLALIDPSKGIARNSMSAILPTANHVHILCHGTVTLNTALASVSLIDLSKMSETLIDNTLGFELIRVPKFEIVIGDAEVAKALERVRNKHELVAIAEAARKLGRPITNSPALAAAVEANTASLVETLVRTVCGPKPESLSEADIQKLLGALERHAIDTATALQYCLAHLLAELKSAFKPKT